MYLSIQYAPLSPTRSGLSSKQYRCCIIKSILFQPVDDMKHYNLSRIDHDNRIKYNDLDLAINGQLGGSDEGSQTNYNCLER